MIPDWLHFLIDPILFDRYAPRLLTGFLTTLQLVGITYTAGMVLGMCIAMARLSSNKVLHYGARGFIYFFRGTPLMAQLFLFYFGIGSFSGFWQSVWLWWFFQSAWYCCLFIFTLNSAAYQAEILRGSIQSVSLGQYEAARALSLSKKVTFYRVILPQSFIMALRPLGNELILLIKSSAVASLVTIYDLMGMAKLAYARTFNLQVYIWAAVLYLISVEIIRRIVYIIEHRLTKHMK
ncbi:ABC transporter permease [Bartonella sp. DGB2]|uniref:ABC transporter permease n=1 Tax=Bartonella sp. DGB2 TaxID=3388426 RepID=UPI00398F9EE4